MKDPRNPLAQDPLANAPVGAPQPSAQPSPYANNPFANLPDVQGQQTQQRLTTPSSVPEGTPFLKDPRNQIALAAMGLGMLAGQSRGESFGQSLGRNALGAISVRGGLDKGANEARDVERKNLREEQSLELSRQKAYSDYELGTERNRIGQAEVVAQNELARLRAQSIANTERYRAKSLTPKSMTIESWLQMEQEQHMMSNPGAPFDMQGAIIRYYQGRKLDEMIQNGSLVIDETGQLLGPEGSPYDIDGTRGGTVGSGGVGDAPEVTNRNTPDYSPLKPEISHGNNEREIEANRRRNNTEVETQLKRARVRMKDPNMTADEYIQKVESFRQFMNSAEFNNVGYLELQKYKRQYGPFLPPKDAAVLDDYLKARRFSEDPTSHATIM